MSGNVIGRAMEIMLVEDSLTSATFTIGMLKKGQVQHRLTWLPDGEEALDFLYHRGKFARAPRPDLILLDLEMPKKTGREVLEVIRGDESLKGIPVVIMTASTAEEDIAATENLQVEGYLTKPINVEQFLNLVRDLKRFWHSELIIP